MSLALDAARAHLCISAVDGEDITIEALAKFIGCLLSEPGVAAGIAERASVERVFCDSRVGGWIVEASSKQRENEEYE